MGWDHQQKQVARAAEAAESHEATAKKSEYNRRAYLKRKRKQDDAGERKLVFKARLRESVLGRMNRVLNEGLATGRYPWKTISDLTEALIIRGFTTLKDDEIIGEMIPHFEMMQQLDRIHTMRREAMMVVSRGREEILELVRINAHAGAANYYHVTMDALHKMPPTEWRDWAIKEMKKQFPDLAAIAAKGVTLARSSDRRAGKERRRLGLRK